MGIKHWYIASSSATLTATAFGSVADAMTQRGNKYKLADSDINALINSGTGTYDVMMDQARYIFIGFVYHQAIE